jgi:hypothetical protein
VDALEMIGRRLARTRERRRQAAALRQRVEGLFANTALGRYSPRRRNGRSQEDTANTIPAPRPRAERVDQGGRHDPWSEWEHLDA